MRSNLDSRVGLELMKQPVAKGACEPGTRPDVVRSIEETAAVKLAKTQAKKVARDGGRRMADTRDEATLGKIGS